MTPEGIQSSNKNEIHEPARAAVESVHAEMKESEKRNNIKRYAEIRDEIARLSAALKRGKDLGLNSGAEGKVKENELGARLGFLTEERRTLERYFDDNKIKSEEYKGTVQ